MAKNPPFEKGGEGGISAASLYQKPSRPLEAVKNSVNHPHPRPPPSRGREFLFHFERLTLSPRPAPYGTGPSGRGWLRGNSSISSQLPFHKGGEKKHPGCTPPTFRPSLIIRGEQGRFPSLVFWNLFGIWILGFGACLSRYFLLSSKAKTGSRFSISSAGCGGRHA